jgi:spermidine synthase
MGLPAGDWFTEATLPYARDDVRISFRVSNRLLDRATDYARIEILDTPLLGRVLVLDGVINIASDTEFVYHEMMVTLPCLRHGEPRSLLVIGGGDGGAAKHALDITSVEKVTQVEIDAGVVDACRRYLPDVGDGALDDPRVDLIIGDGVDFVAATEERFDVVVLDVSDPVPGGPAAGLTTGEFYASVKDVLAEGGVLATHCGPLLLESRKAQQLSQELANLFEDVALHTALVPEFELTQFGFLICTDREPPTTLDIRRRYETLLRRPTGFLTTDTYFSSTVLPPYLQQLLGQE